MFRHYVRQLARTAVQVAFSRRKYKALLKTSIEDLTERARTLSVATDFFSSSVQSIVTRAPFGNSMLVVAPHQDDEVIGCGGALALQRHSGRLSTVVVLQDGADEHAQVSMTRDALRERRNAESRSAAKVISAEEPIFIGSQNLYADRSQIAHALQEILKSRDVDVIFTPFVLDSHPDHRACNEILADALIQRGRPDIRIMQYEVWSSCIPNVVIVIDDVIKEKEQMLACFSFANSAVNYSHATIGLNMFHSRLLPAGGGLYVEAYFEARCKDYLDLVEGVLMSGARARK